MKRVLQNHSDPRLLEQVPRNRKERPRPVIRSLKDLLVPKSAAHQDNALPLRVEPLASEPVSGEAVYFVKDLRGLVRVNPQDIRFLQADGNYVELRMTNQRVVLRNSLAELLKMLPPGLMCQVNRSQAVNVQHLNLISNDEVHLGDLAFTLSKIYRSALLACVQVIAAR